MVPALAGQVAAELKAPVPSTVDEQEDVAPTFTLLGEQATATELPSSRLKMAMVAEPDTLGVRVEVAVMVAVPEAGTVAGAA